MEDISDVVKEAAQRIINGELSFQGAVDLILRKYSHHLVLHHYDGEVEKIKDMLCEALIEIEKELYKIEYIYSEATDIALKIMNGMMSYGTGVYKLTETFPLNYIVANSDKAVIMAEELIDDRLSKLEDRDFNIEKTYAVAKAVVARLKEGNIDKQCAIDHIFYTFPQIYRKRHFKEAIILAVDLFEWAMMEN